ncbi:MAG: LacI family DNA-binding transcriptional regulator [Pseudomonadota bacterium]
MAKPTLRDVAKRAGLSTATVDRVLHERDGISERAKKKVREAIHELNFGKIPESLSSRPKPVMRFAFLLPHLHTSFADEMVQAALAAPAAVDDVDVLIEIIGIDLIDGTELIRELDAISPDDFDGVALFAVDVPGVRSAIDRAVSRNLKVVTLVADIPTSMRHHFVGIDNMAAGRVAGTLMGRFAANRSGNVGMIIGSHRQRDHIDRRLGFEQVLQSNFPNLRLLPVEEGASRHEKNRVITEKFLQNHDELVGIYSIAAGNSGILDALYDKALDEDLIVILHELSDPVRKALQDGTIDAVISQNTGHIARSAVRVLRAHCKGVQIVHALEQIGTDIYLADNLP